MKKIKSLDVVELLSKDELKNIFGGFGREEGGGEGACESGTACESDSDCPGSCHCRKDPVMGDECR